MYIVDAAVKLKLILRKAEAASDLSNPYSRRGTLAGSASQGRVRAPSSGED